MPPQTRWDVVVVLSAREEATLLGHFIAVLAVRADHPGHADYAAYDEAHDGGVCFPVGRLRIPTSGRRPDVLGVPVGVRSAPREALEHGTYGILPPPPMIASSSAGWWWWSQRLTM